MANDAEVDQHLARAEAALALRRWPEAEAAARRALALDTASEGGFAFLSRALAGQSRFDEAIAAAEAGLGATPDSEWLHRLRGWSLLESGRRFEALAAAEEAVRLFPEGGAGHQLRAQVLLGLGRVTEARMAAGLAVTLAPLTPEFHAQLGDTWLKEDPAEAERHYRASLTIVPTQAMVLNNLGVALQRQRRREEAAQAFKAALSLDPTHRLPKLNAYGASAAVLRRSPWGWVGVGLTLPMMVLLLWAWRLEGRSFALAFGGAAAIFGLQLVLYRHASKVGLARLARLDPQLHAIRLQLVRDLAAGREVLAPSWQLWTGRAIAVFGAATLLAALGGEVYVLHQYLSYPQAPRRTTLEASLPDEWIVLEGSALDCRTARVVRGRGYVAGMSKGGRTFVADYSGTLDCDGSGPEIRGVVSDLNPRLATSLAQAGFAIPPGRVAELCTSCGPSASLAIVALLLLFVAMSSYLLWEGLRLARRAAAVRVHRG